MHGGGRFPLTGSCSGARVSCARTLGLFQYLAPTLAALLAVVFYGETFGEMRALALLCIWAGIVLFSVDSVRAEVQATR